MNTDNRGLSVDIDSILELLREVREELKGLRLEFQKDISSVGNKVDCLSVNIQALAGEQAVLKEKVSVLERSNEGRGKRLGDVETEIAVLKTGLGTKDKTKADIGNLAKWGVGIILAVATFVIGKTL